MEMYVFMEAQMTELNQCPFCGNTPFLRSYRQALTQTAYCDICDVELPITRWNRRVYPPEVQQALDKQKPELAIITKELGYNPDGDIYDVGCPDCGKVLRYVNFVRGATTDCIRHCMDCGKKMNVRIDAEVEDE